MATIMPREQVADGLLYSALPFSALQVEKFRASFAMLPMSMPRVGVVGQLCDFQVLLDNKFLSGKIDLWELVP